MITRYTKTTRYYTSCDRNPNLDLTTHVLPKEDQTFKYMSIWGLFSFKLVTQNSTTEESISTKQNAQIRLGFDQAIQSVFKFQEIQQIQIQVMVQPVITALRRGSQRIRTSRSSSTTRDFQKARYRQTKTKQNNQAKH